MRQRLTSSPRWLYLTTIILIGVALLLLAQLLRRFEADLQANVQGLQRVLADEKLLRDPSDPYVRFGPIEEIISKYQGHPYLREITVTKFFRDKEEVVYPFYWPALQAAGLSELPALRRHPHPARSEPDVLKLPLVSRGSLLGHLYARVDRSAVRSVQLAIASFTLILLAFAGLFLGQFRRQQAVISRTVIELEQKRRELVRLERLALAGQLSASLLHDIKKPVLNIKSDLEDMLDGATQLPEEVRERIQALREQARMFFEILRSGNLERFVRGEGEKEYVDIAEAVRTSLGLVQYEKGQVELEVDMGDAPLLVLAEPAQLVQVFSNIILNAYQAMEGQGRLSIRGRRDGDRIRISFSDTGPGIPPEARESIFAPFYTTKSVEKGTGLGLYISREIVQQLGGDILVESSEQGTTFIVILPSG